MAEAYRVTLTATLVSKIEQRSREDRKIMAAFVSSLREHGFDTILSAEAFDVPRLDLEFVEPGEIPDLVWARFFLTLNDGVIALTARRSADRLLLEEG